MTNEESQKIIYSTNQRITKYSSNVIRRGLDLASKLPRQYWRCICEFTHPRKSIASVALGSNSQSLVIVDRWGTINIWDLKNKVLLCKPYSCHQNKPPLPREIFYETNLAFYELFRKRGGTFHLEITPDDQTLISIGQQEIKLWDLGSGQLTQSLNSVFESSINSARKIIAHSSHSEQIKVWGFRTRRLLSELDTEFNTVEHIALSSDCQFLAASGNKLVGGNWEEEEYINEHSIKIWNLPTGKVLHVVNKYIDTENIKEDPSILISSDSKTLISIELEWEDDCENIYIAKIWSLQTGDLLYTLQLGADSVAITKDDRLIACSTDSRVANVWNLATGELLETLVGHDDTINYFAIGLDNQMLISGSQDGTLIIWDIKAGELLHKLEEHWSSIHSIEISLDGQTFVSTDTDGTVKVWRLFQLKADDQDIQESQHFEFQLISEKLIEVSSEELFKDGLSKYNQKDYQGAFEDFTQVLNYDPDNGYAYIYRGSARSALGDKQGAIADYTQVLQINPSYAEIYNDRGLIHAELSDHSRAIEDYTQALRIDSNLLAAYLNRVSSNLQLEKYSDALEDFEQAMQIDPGSAEVYNNAFKKQEGMEEAIQLLAQGCIIQGDACYTSGDYQRAIEAYTQVLSLDSTNAKAYNRRSTAHSALRDYQGAMEDLQKARNPSLAKNTDYQFLDCLRILAQITKQS